ASGVRVPGPLPAAKAGGSSRKGLWVAAVGLIAMGGVWFLLSRADDRAPAPTAGGAGTGTAVQPLPPRVKGGAAPVAAGGAPTAGGGAGTPGNPADPRRQNAQALQAEGARNENQRREEAGRFVLVKWTQEDFSLPPDQARPNEEYVLARVLLENHGYPQLAIGPGVFVWKADGREYPAESSASASGLLAGGVLQSRAMTDGQRAAGMLLFKVRPRSNKGSLEYRPTITGVAVRYVRE
ncbi:MAG: hypothetical protein HZA54_19475, partial [Planctomycetes bacterium]|nr:hypothetical protein [Planctomycetota bacterium]